MDNPLIAIKRRKARHPERSEGSPEARVYPSSPAPQDDGYGSEPKLRLSLLALRC